MAPGLVCCVCKREEASTGSLHAHHLSHHTPEELSLALLWSQRLLTVAPDTKKDDDALRCSLAKYPQFLLCTVQPGHDKQNPLPAQSQESSVSKQIPNYDNLMDRSEILKNLLKTQGPLNLQSNDMVLNSNGTSPTRNIQPTESLSRPCYSFNTCETIDNRNSSRMLRKKQHVNYCETETVVVAERPDSSVCHTFLQAAESNQESMKGNPDAKENEGQNLNTISEKPIINKQNKWKISLVNRSRAEKKLLEEKKCNKNVQLQNGSPASDSSRVKVECGAPNMANQSPHLYHALLGQRDDPSQPPHDEPPPVKRNRQDVPVKKRRPLMGSPKKSAPTPVPVYNRSILKKQSPVPPPTSNIHSGIFEINKQFTKAEEKTNELQSQITNQESNDSVMSQPPTPPKVPPPQSDRRFTCSQCSCAYKKKSHLERHIRSHTGERPFPCEVCQKSFSVKSVLKQHLRIHTGEKPFSCSVCGARFPQTSGLMTHMMLHTGKPYKCDYCTKSFVSNHKLVHHLRSHGGPRPHACDKCSLGFFTTSALHEHQSRIHLNEKKFFCDICRASFKLEVSLKVHLDGHIQELGGEEIIDHLVKQQEQASDDSNHSNSVL